MPSTVSIAISVEVKIDPALFIKLASWCASALFVCGQAFWVIITTVVVRIYSPLGHGGNTHINVSFGTRVHCCSE